MKILSKSSMYGIRAALFVASVAGERKYVPIREISDGLHISFHFLTKILQMLTHHKIMTSYRGPNGGVSLARPARDITLMEMIIAIEPDTCLKECILGLPGCGEEKPCPLHTFWGGTRDQIQLMFETTNLEDLGRKIREDGVRLST
jgi:Rrf2 family protein